MTVLSGSEDANRCGVLELFINAYHHKSTEKNHLKTCRICLMKTFKTFRNFSKVICRKLEFRIRFRSFNIDVFSYVRSSYIVPVELHKKPCGSKQRSVESLRNSVFRGLLGPGCLAATMKKVTSFGWRQVSNSPKIQHCSKT